MPQALPQASYHVSGSVTCAPSMRVFLYARFSLMNHIFEYLVQELDQAYPASSYVRSGSRLTAS